MRKRKLILAFLLCLAAIPGLAQNRLNGKWATDKPENQNDVPNFQRARSVQLELSIEDARGSGSVAMGGLGGTFMTFKDGKLNGNKLQFKTTPDKDPNAVTTWTVELVDENTVLLSHNMVEVYNPGRAAPPQPVQVPRPGQAAAISQGITSVSVSGIVQDSSKANIPGVTVTAIGAAGANLTTTTDEAGRYSFSNVPAGNYAITVTLPGFNPATVNNLSVGNGQVQQDFTMEVRGPLQWTLASCSSADQVLCVVLKRAK
jgi:hypothetical protein